jgi:hypothetical protein
MKIYFDLKWKIIALFAINLLCSNIYAQQETHWVNDYLYSAWTGYEQQMCNNYIAQKAFFGKSPAEACAGVRKYIPESCDYVPTPPKEFFSSMYSTVVLKGDNICEITYTFRSKYGYPDYNPSSQKWGITRSCPNDEPKPTPAAFRAAEDFNVKKADPNICAYYCSAGSTKVGNVWCQPQPCSVKPLTTYHFDG